MEHVVTAYPIRKGPERLQYRCVDCERKSTRVGNIQHTSNCPLTTQDTVSSPRFSTDGITEVTEIASDIITLSEKGNSHHEALSLMETDDRVTWGAAGTSGRICFSLGSTTVDGTPYNTETVDGCESESSWVLKIEPGIRTEKLKWVQTYLNSSGTMPLCVPGPTYSSQQLAVQRSMGRGSS